MSPKIIEHTEFHDASTFGNPDDWVEGLKEYRLVDGSHLNKISASKFESVKSGVKLRVSS